MISACKKNYEYQSPWPLWPLVGVSPASFTEPCRAVRGHRVMTQGLV